MNYTFLAGAVLGLLTFQRASAQASKTQALEQEILREGLALYESERASWVATDVLMAQKPDVQHLIGYFSYADGDSVRTVFMQQEGNTFSARHSFSFNRAAITPAAVRQFAARPASEREQKLFALRLQVMEELESNKVLGTPYRFPENTRPNVVLLDQGPSVRAYVLTGPQEGGILPLGNDFLFRFTERGKLSKVERLHNSYIAMRLPEGYTTIEAGMHSHLPAHPYITPTDICSLLLYREAVPAPQHYVMGKEYVSLFDLEKRQLVFLTRKAFDKIQKSRKEATTSND
ncbi:hypothetical protein GCM10027346_00410 [Hymenobacter seoulensis]